MKGKIQESILGTHEAFSVEILNSILGVARTLKLYEAES